MKISIAAARIEREALRVGKRKLDGKKLSEFDPALLIVGDGSFSEHLDTHAAAGLYYEMLALKARHRAERLQQKFDDWHSEKYQEANSELMEKLEVRKPNIADVENRVKFKYPTSYKRYRRLIESANMDAKRVQIWAVQWKVKSFTMDDRTRLYRKEEDEGLRSNVKKHMRGKRHNED